MLIDTDAVRAGATTLDGVASDVAARRSAVFQLARDTHWIAPAAARIQVDIAQHDARGREAVAGLHAAARHLRRLADAVEELQQRMRAAHDSRVGALEGRLADLPADSTDEAGVLGSQLSGLPPPQDPHWAHQVQVPAVPLPALTPVSPQPLAPMGPYVGVSVETGPVRLLGESVGRLSQDIAAARERCAAPRSLLLWQLDTYGLPGSVAGAFVEEVSGASSDLAAAGLGFDMDARRTASLAGILEKADAAQLPQGDLLNDPLLTRAVDLAAALTTGMDPDGMWEAVGDADAEQLAWLMTVVPELQSSLGAKKDDDGQPFSWFDRMDSLDSITNILGAPGEMAPQANRAAAGAGRYAKTIKPVKGSTLAQRQAYNAAIRQMRAVRSTAATVTAVSRSPALRVLSVLNRPLSATTPVLRNIPVLSVLMTGIATADDIHGGMSPEGAVIKNVSSTAAGLGAAALTTMAISGTALAAAPLAPVILAIGVGALVAYGTDKLLEAYGDDIADFALDTGEAVWNTGRWTGEKLLDGGRLALDGGRAALDGAADVGGAVGGFAEDSWDWAFG